MVRAFATYVRLLLVPTGLSMTYHFPLERSLFQMSVFPSFCLLALAVTAAVLTFRRSVYVSFGLFWFAVTMLPVSNIVPMNAVVADRWLYLPSMGFCMLAALTVSRLTARGGLRKTFTVSVVTALIFCHMVLTVSRNNDWRNPISLWRKTIEACPTSFIAYGNLGLEYLKQNRIHEAIEALNRALELNSRLVAPHMNLATCYERLGQVNMAIKHYKAALASPLLDNPAWNHYKLAGCFERNDRSREAIEHYEAAVDAKPDFAQAHRRLGSLYAPRDIDRAIEHLERARSLGLEDSAGCYELGLLYYRRGNLAMAEAVLRHCLAQDPRNALIRDLLERIEKEEKQDLIKDRQTKDS
jgi:tetratricopeptide (TPR) repeat protein